MKRILVADDHAVVRKGLKETLEEELHDLQFGEAENHQQVLDKVWKEHWDLVMLDINMDRRNGLEVLEQIHNPTPNSPFSSSACTLSRNWRARPQTRRRRLPQQTERPRGTGDRRAQRPGRAPIHQCRPGRPPGRQRPAGRETPCTKPFPPANTRSCS